MHWALGLNLAAYLAMRRALGADEPAPILPSDIPHTGILKESR